MISSGRWLVPVIAAVFAAASGFGIAQAMASPSEEEPDSSTSSKDQSSSGSPIQAVPDDVDLSTFDPTGSTPASELDSSDFLKGTTPLSECPDALEFFEQPDVQEFHEKNFGYVPGPTYHWSGGCPDLSALKSTYEAARADLADGGQG